MKSISYKALIWLMEISFFLFVVVVILVLGFYLRDMVRHDYEANFSFGKIQSIRLVEANNQKISVEAKDESVSNPYLVANHWNLNFNTKDTRIKTFVFSALALQLIYLLFLLFLVRKFVYSLKQGSPFSLENVRRLKIIGVLVLMIEPIQWVGGKVVSGWVDSHFVINHNLTKSASLGFSIDSGSFSWKWILAGLLILVIGEVFHQGLKMKEEQDLTI